MLRRFRTRVSGCAAVLAAASLLGCAPFAASPAAGLAGTQWTVVELDGEPVEPEVTPTLAIAEDGRVGGSDGCNRFSGGLTLDARGGAVADPRGAISTRMACHGARDRVSRRYNALRAAVVGWRLEDGRLLLHTADRRTIVLRRGG